MARLKKLRDRTVVSVVMESTLKDWLDGEARNTGKSFSEVVRNKLAIAGAIPAEPSTGPAQDPDVKAIVRLLTNMKPMKNFSIARAVITIALKEVGGSVSVSRIRKAVEATVFELEGAGIGLHTEEEGSGRELSGFNCWYLAEVPTKRELEGVSK